MDDITREVYQAHFQSNETFKEVYNLIQGISKTKRLLTKSEWRLQSILREKFIPSINVSSALGITQKRITMKVDKGDFIGIRVGRTLWLLKESLEDNGYEFEDDIESELINA